MKKKTNLIIIAMQEELNVLLSLLPSVEKEDSDLGTLYSFKINNIEYTLILGKIGKVFTAFNLGRIIERYDIIRIFNMGTSGAISSSLNIGDVIVANEVIYHDVDVTSFAYEYGQVPSCPISFNLDEEYINKHLKTNYDAFKVHRGKVISGDTFLNKNNINKIPSIILKNALCGEMEAGAIAQVAYYLNIPTIIIRTISDNIYTPSNHIDMDNNLYKACVNGSKVLIDLLGK